MKEWFVKSFVSQYILYSSIVELKIMKLDEAVKFLSPYRTNWVI